MSLPTDVVDHTSKTRNPSEQDLYAEITLYDDFHEAIPTWFRISQFTQILAKTPDIANRVRSLNVIPIHGPPNSQQHEATSSLLNSVAFLLPLFARLTSFEIVGHSDMDYYKCTDFPWYTIPETFCQVFLRLLHLDLSPVLKDVHICGINFFPMSLLNDCRNVRVTLKCCKEIQDDRNSTNLGDKVRLLEPFEHFSIQDYDETSMNNIASWITMRGLRSLKFVNSIHSLDLFPPLLVACSNSLTDLCIDISGYRSPYQLSNDSAIHLNGEVVQYPFTLADLPNLTRLTVHHALSHLSPSSDGFWTLDSPIPAILALVSTALPTLQRLSVDSLSMFREEFEQLPDPVVIWNPFIPLATHCSSASILMDISPSFWLPSSRIFNLFSPFTDYKGLTSYVEKGAVVISKGVREETRAFDLEYDRKKLTIQDLHFVIPDADDEPVSVE